jgi:hypothetical protein
MCGTIQGTLKCKTGKDMQIKFCKVMAAPMLTCGSENCALTESERRKIET